jgi:hypothetical protein
MNEVIGSGFFDAIIFAEEGYRKEMPRWNKKAVVIRNTYNKVFEADLSHKKQEENITMLYSGTIAESYGIFTAIDFIDHFYLKYPSVRLLIAGYCANRKLLKKIKSLIQSKPYIQLIGGEKLVPHEDIIRYIQTADFGLVCYDLNPSIENCFPTKIYEYMANRLPIIIQNYKPWSLFCLKYDAAIEVDFQDIDYDNIYLKLLNQSFYDKGLPGSIYWQEDEKKLLNLIDNILS